MNYPHCKNTDFSNSQLQKACTGVGIQYIHVPELGIESEQRHDLSSQADYEKNPHQCHRSRVAKALMELPDIHYTFKPL